MILTDEEAKARLNNPLNLVNRLVNGNGSSSSNNKSSPAMSLFGLGKTSPSNQSPTPKQPYNFQTSIPPANPPPLAAPETPQEKFDLAIALRLDKSISVQDEPEILPEKKPEPTHIDTQQPVGLDDLISNADAQLKLSSAHNNALDVLNLALRRMADEIPNMKGDKLPPIISASTKVVETIRKEKIESNKLNKNQNVHYHFYTPKQRQMEEYRTIEVESHVIEESANG